MKLIQHCLLTRNPTYCTVGKTVKNTEDSKKSIDEIVKEVIQGKWGNGAERKEKLTAAGYDYTSVQKRVNEMLKQYALDNRIILDYLQV